MMAMEEQPGRRWFEWLLAILAAVNCAAVAIPAMAGNPPGWPFPGLYLLEILLAGLVNLYPVATDPPSDSKWSAVPWACSGIMLSFVIVGAWTIGFLLIPAMVSFLLIGILADRRKKGNIALHFLVLIVAALVQALVFFLFISF